MFSRMAQNSNKFVNGIARMSCAAVPVCAEQANRKTFVFEIPLFTIDAFSLVFESNEHSDGSVTVTANFEMKLKPDYEETTTETSVTETTNDR